MSAPAAVHDHIEAHAQALQGVRDAVSQVIRGKADVIERALITMVAGGHLLVEDIPGVGKSTLSRALAAACGGTFSRIQFTSDLLPADLIGINVWRASQEAFEFRKGPLFANVVLADEVNRAPPRTQSALLEAMGEGQVSIDGKTLPLPRPFTVLATQNPEEHHGTYPLPESQRDRFVLRTTMGYAAADVEASLLQSGSTEETLPEAVLRPGQLAELQDAARAIHVHAELAAYAQRVVQATRDDAKVRLGVSTRGALAWVAAGRARSLIQGRSSLALDDLQELAVPALAHRIVPAQTGAGAQSGLAEEITRDIVAAVPVPV